MIDVLWLGGTGWGGGGDGISEEFAKWLDPERFAFRFVRYPATYGNGPSYGDSRAAGRTALREAIKATTGPVVIGGYSQGAAIAGDIAADIGTTMPRVRACALIADPMRPEGCLHPGAWLVGGYGISGQRLIVGVPTYWTAAAGDPITALPAGNPLRTIADMTEWFSLSSPDAAWRWGQALLADAKRGGRQRWWSIENWQSWGGAVDFARGYLFGGRHTDDYIRHGYARRLAEHINRAVTQ